MNWAAWTHRSRATRLVSVLLLVGVATACGGPAPSGTSSADNPSPSLATEAATATATPSPPRGDPCLTFTNRLLAGMTRANLLLAAVNTAALESARAAYEANEEITAWAFVEHATTGEDPPDSRYDAAYAAYRDGLTAMYFGSQALALVLIDYDEVEDRDSVEEHQAEVNEGINRIGEAVDLLATSDCAAPIRAYSPDPTASPLALPVDPKTAYETVASDINERMSILRDTWAKSMTRATDLAVIERDARTWLASISWPISLEAEAAALDEALLATAEFLDGEVPRSPDDVTTFLASAFLDNLSPGTGSGPLHDQRQAAASIRAALGMPTMGEWDVL